MKISIIIGSILILMIVVLIFKSCSKGISRILLTENKVYQWKIYHVTEKNYPSGKFRYFEVYLGKQQLVLPKELTGGVRDVSRFHAAGSFAGHETNYNAVLITFEAISKDARGFDQRNMVNILVSASGNNTVLVKDLCTGDTSILNLKK